MENEKKLQEDSKDAETLNYEKSKKGLAELYEEKYKVDVLHYPRNPEEEKVKDEVTILAKELFHKFDQLTNFHFTPSFVNDEIKVILIFDNFSRLLEKSQHLPLKKLSLSQSLKLSALPRRRYTKMLILQI